MTDPRGRGALADRTSLLAYTAGWAVTRRVPEPVARAAFTRMADLVWRRRPRQVRRLEANLRRVRPDLDGAGLRELSRAGMRSYFRYWCEAFRLPAMTRADILDAVVVEGAERFRSAVEAGRGVVCALPHLGNWDLAGAWWGVGLGTPLTTVAERLRPVELFDRFVAYRERLGMEVLPLGRDGDLFGALIRRLRVGRVVALVADRDLSRNGVEVRFFGDTARMPAGPATLALRSGAPLIPVITWYDGPRLRLRFGDPLPAPTGGAAVRVMTQSMADAFAGGIADHPQDWHMLQRLWSGDEASEPCE